VSKNGYKKFLNESKITDGLLREHIHSECWKEAVKACTTGINKREFEIKRLKALRVNLALEAGIRVCRENCQYIPKEVTVLSGDPVVVVCGKYGKVLQLGWGVLRLEECDEE